MEGERKFKTIDELTLMDDYMFAAVMRDTRHLKPMLEYILNIRIAKIELIEPQKTEKEGYGSKGIRLDLYVEDEKHTIYSVDVQTTDKRNLPRRMRYYQSVIDIHVLRPGVDYQNLRTSFVIFICNYDPFGLGRYVYTFENVCREEPELLFSDGTTKVIVNTKGTKGAISEELKKETANAATRTSRVFLSTLVGGFEWKGNPSAKESKAKADQTVSEWTQERITEGAEAVRNAFNEWLAMIAGKRAYAVEADRLLKEKVGVFDREIVDFFMASEVVEPEPTICIMIHGWEYGRFWMKAEADAAKSEAKDKKREKQT